MTPEQEAELWRYVMACMKQAEKYTRMAAEAADQIKASKKQKLELVKNDRGDER